MMVDLPAPEGPTKAIVSPGSIVKLISFRADNSGLLGKEKLTFLNSIVPTMGSLGNSGSTTESCALSSSTKRSVAPAALCSSAHNSESAAVELATIVA